jgi:hypothetical protein
MTDDTEVTLERNPTTDGGRGPRELQLARKPIGPAN